MLLLTIIKSRPIVSFISGFIVGGVVFGKKTPINYQIVLYLLSRILLALSSIVYEKYFPERLLLK
jgi:Na+/serine symporter